MNIVSAYVYNNPCYQQNIARLDSRYIKFQNQGPQGLMLHSVGCAQPNAMTFIERWNKSSYDSACVHAFIDANTGTIFQCMPWNFRGWHGAGSCNNTHVGVEMCESAAITYTGGSTFNVRDRARAQADCKRAYKAAVELFAMLCEKYNLSPSKICSHKEGNEMGIASNHGDPEHYWQGLGMSYTMDGFRADVKAQIAKNKKAKEEPEMTEKQVKEYVANELKAMKAQMEAAARAQVKQELEEELGKYIEEAKDIPHVGVMNEVRELLDLEVINGGTPAQENPNDIFLPYNVLRALVVAKRYVDYKLKEAEKPTEPIEPTEPEKTEAS